MILVALIKQELNSKQLYSNFERLDSLDKDSSSLLEDVRNVELIYKNSEKILQDVNDKLTILNTDSKAKTLQINDIVNQINLLLELFRIFMKFSKNATVNCSKNTQCLIDRNHEINVTNKA